MKTVIPFVLFAVLACSLPLSAESPYIFGLHFHRDAANIDCMGGKPGWVTGLEVSTAAPDAAKFKRIVNEGHTIILRLDYAADQTFPSVSSNYADFASNYAYWVYKLRDYCHIWLIGNEQTMNAECFRQVRRAVHAIQPEAIFCAGCPWSIPDTFRNIGDYVDGIANHTYATDWIAEIDASIPSGKTKLAYITEFQSAPPNMNPQDLRSAFAAFNTYNATHEHKLQAACKFVYYEFGSQYTSLQMQPMQNGDFNLAASVNNYTNSYAQPYITLSDISETGEDAATTRISWTTDVGATGQIEYWEDREIDQHFSAFHDTETTSHSVTIGPLVPGRTYHYVVKSYGSGRPLTLSDVQTFVHRAPGSGTLVGQVRTYSGVPVDQATVTVVPGDHSYKTDSQGRFTLEGYPAGSYAVNCSSPYTNAIKQSGVVVTPGETTECDLRVTPRVNYLSNAGFESYLTGWTSFGSAPTILSGSWYGGITSHGGSRFAGCASAGSASVGGCYQRVTGLPSGAYSFSVFARQYHGDNPYRGTRDRIGIDRTGGTDPNSASVSWSDWHYNFWHWESWWNQLTTPSVMVTGGNATVFMQYSDTIGSGWHVHAYDDGALMSSALQTQTAADLSAAKQFVDGTPVQLGGVIASVDRGAIEADVTYVQDPDRACGIKVRLTGLPTAVLEGNSVSLTGVLSTGADGERCIDATSISAVAGPGVLPLGLQIGDAGGSDFRYEPGPPKSGQRGVAGGTGLNNIALLVRVAGSITGSGDGFVLVADGSPTPLKVDVSGLAGVPSEGMVAVTGVLSVESFGDQLIPVLRPRKDGDLQVFGSSR